MRVVYIVERGWRAAADPPHNFFSIDPDSASDRFFQELKESFNYGLFCPPVNGKAGKFLDEERRLGDYPFNGPVGYLEVRYTFLSIVRI